MSPLRLDDILLGKHSPNAGSLASVSKRCAGRPGRDHDYPERGLHCADWEKRVGKVNTRQAFQRAAPPDHWNGRSRGLDTASTRSEKLSRIVGYVFQNPD